MTYVPTVPVAVPEGAAAPPAPPAPPAGTLTGEPGAGGSLPDGEADPDPPLDGEPAPGEPAEPDDPELPVEGELEPGEPAEPGEPDEPMVPLEGAPVDPPAPGVGVTVTVK